MNMSRGSSVDRDAKEKERGRRDCLVIMGGGGREKEKEGG